MRTKEIEIGTYTEWKEFNEDVAQSILDNNRTINTDYNWSTWTLEAFCETLDNRGFDIQLSDIQFTGFHSQGDGASFTGSVNILDYLRYNKILSKYSALVRAIKNDLVENAVQIERSASNYSHENTCYADDIVRYEECSALVDFQIEEVQELIEETRCNYSKELYTDLNETYDDLISDETIIETLEANAYEFDEDGEIV